MNKVSLIATSQGVPSDLARTLTEVQSFTQKFPVQWEILIVLDPPLKNDLPTLPASNAEERVQIRVLQNNKHLGRAQSLQKALLEATGEVIITFSLEMTIPLAEIFQFLQELTVDPKLDLVVGNRFTSRKKMTSQKSSWQQTLEKIIKEKWDAKGPLSLTDPLCAYFGVRKSSLDAIRDRIQLKSWYFMPEILRWAHRQNWKIHEVPILSQDQKPSQIPLKKEFFRAAFLP